MSNSKYSNEADFKLVIFGWIETIIGFPKGGNPDKYNELTDKLYEFTHPSASKGYLMGYEAGIKAAIEALPEKSPMGLTRLTPETEGIWNHDEEVGRANYNNGFDDATNQAKSNLKALIGGDDE